MSEPRRALARADRTRIEFRIWLHFFSCNRKPASRSGTISAVGSNGIFMNICLDIGGNLNYKRSWDLTTIPDKLLNSEFSRRRARKRQVEISDDPEVAESRRKQREYRAQRRREGKDKNKPK
jgi:hypothetical protein